MLLVQTTVNCVLLTILSVQPAALGMGSSLEVNVLVVLTFSAVTVKTITIFALNAHGSTE